MEIKKTIFKNLLEIKYIKHLDSRGSFVKIFNKLNNNKFNNECYESYVSTSHKGSSRGLHAQKGRYAQDKLIYCVQGKMLDVAVDVRRNSTTYGKIYKKKINSSSNIALFVPKGFMHGIIALENDTIIVTYCSKPYNPKSEYGVRLDSLFTKKTKIKLIISKKDTKLPTLNKFLKK
ncbi:dTDP-4-dehydrorhamnose 3,5-epimerase family protein [Candidatus Pelagibacter sp.]|nr:dTDP-4-dehydrorhamnose 3,5-epimerase family protein [Candidatus Pelagibacter sp.]